MVVVFLLVFWILIYLFFWACLTICYASQFIFVFIASFTAQNLGQEKKTRKMISWGIADHSEMSMNRNGKINIVTIISTRVLLLSLSIVYFCVFLLAWMRCLIGRYRSEFSSGRCDRWWEVTACVVGRGRDQCQLHAHYFSCIRMSQYQIAMHVPFGCATEKICQSAGTSRHVYDCRLSPCKGQRGGNVQVNYASRWFLARYGRHKRLTKYIRGLAGPRLVLFSFFFKCLLSL